MFINLSNHPSGKWSSEQHAAALALSRELNKEQYPDGEIKDIQFPNIPPDASTQDVYSLAEAYYQQITNNIAPLTPMHIMGEMTFTCTLIAMLQKGGFRCVAATSQRNTIENADGSKTIVFNFVQFRDYPQI